MDKSGVTVSLIIILFTVFTSAAFFQDEGTDFNNGTYENTNYNGTGVVLASNQLTGNYISQIFNTASVSTWKNMTWSKGGKYGVDYPDNKGSDGISMSSNTLLLHLDESSGTFYDSSGSDNNGLDIGSVVRGSNGVFSNSVGISGNDKYVRVPYHSSLSMNESYSIEIWMKPSTSAEAWKRFFYRSGHFDFTLINSDRIRFYQNGYAQIDSSISVVRNKWNHIVATVEPSSNGQDYIKLYINGQLAGTVGPTWGPPLVSTNEIRIGGAGGSDYVNGNYDEVAIYNGRVLSLSEVTERYKRGALSLNAYVRTCDDSCTTEEWNDIADEGFVDFNLDDSSYFQYKFNLSRLSTNINPILYNVSINYVSSDDDPPTFSNFIESPTNNSEYSQGQNYQFNVTVNDDGSIHTALINFNGINYSVSNNSNNYFFSRSDLPAGVYPYYWIANDSNGNLGISNLRYFYVKKASSSTTLVFDKVSPQIYGTALNVSCLDSNPEANPKLFRGTTDVSSENGQNIILAAGTYNYKCNVSQTQNYTSAEDLDSFVISKASQTAELSINESSINYGQLVEAECNGDLFLDGANISAQIGEALLLSGGNHQFSCRLYENQNYSYDDDNQTISVIQNISITSVITDPVSSIVYGNFSNFSCFNSAGLTTSLYINGSLKNSEKGQEIVRAAGSYNVSCISTGNENFTGSFGSIIYNIAKADGSVNLKLNGNSDNLTISYPQQVNASASTLFGTVSLYRNSTQINEENNLNESLKAGYYNYTAISSGDQNHTSFAVSYLLEVSKGTPTITFQLNGISDNLSVDYLQFLNASAKSSGGTINLYRNGNRIDSENNQKIVLAAGFYQYKANVTGNENFTSLEGVNLYANVTKILPENLQILINPDSTVNYLTSTIAEATETNNGDSDLIYRLFRNGSLIGSANGVIGYVNSPPAVLDAGTYNYVFNTSGGQNYTSGSVNAALVVNKISNPVVLLLNGQAENLSLTYPQQINASASSSSGAFGLYRNGSRIDYENGQKIILASGVYHYFANSSGNQNYLSNSSGKEYYLNIEKAQSEINLLLNGLNDNISVTDNDNVQISASRVLGEGNISVYVDGNLVYSGLSFSQSSNFSAGAVNVTLYYSETQNYTSSFETFWINVTDATAPSISIFSPGSGAAFGYNESISLLYSVSDDALESCWYNIDEHENITLTDCVNSSFDVNGSGSYTLNFFANDSFGNTVKKSVSFTVNLGAPTISLVSPSGYLKNQSVTFSYIPSDIDLESCELWGNFSGYFERMATDFNPENENINQFYFNISDGHYTWNIKCNDSSGHFQSTGNQSFYIDTILPAITLNNPSGELKTKNIGASWIVTDATPVLCKYNVYRGETIEIGNTSVNCSAGATSFNLTIDATNFIFNFFAVDSAGNNNYANSSFSVDTTVIPVIPNDGGGSGGGGGGGFGGGSGGGAIRSHLEIDPIKIIASIGETKSLKVVVKNAGRTSANKCKLVATNNNYLETKDIFNIGVGEIIEFGFLLKASDKEIKNMNLTIECLDNVSKQVPLEILILENSLNINIEEMKLSKDKLILNYSIEPSSTGLESIYFRVENSEGEVVKEESKNLELKINERYSDLIEFMLPDDETGMLKLSIGNGKEIIYVEENFIYGGNTITGFALSNFLEEYSYLGIVMFLFLVAGIFVVKRIFELRRKKRVTKWNWGWTK